MKTTRILITSAAAFAVLLSVPLRAEGDKQPPKGGDTKEKKEAVKPYKLTTCIVSDEKLGAMGESFVFVYQGQEIKLCCEGCKKKFDKDPAKYLKKLEGK